MALSAWRCLHGVVAQKYGTICATIPENQPVTSKIAIVPQQSSDYCGTIYFSAMI
jgi:hypothetical protein